MFVKMGNSCNDSQQNWRKHLRSFAVYCVLNNTQLGEPFSWPGQKPTKKNDYKNVIFHNKSRIKQMKRRFTVFTSCQ